MSVRIDHAAAYVADLERSKEFYVRYFSGAPGERYHNPWTGLMTYFLSFEGGARLELMQRPGREDPATTTQRGWTHLAFSVGSTDDVDTLTARLVGDGYTVTSGPRVTGDGYYESVVLDPDGHDVEIVADPPVA